MALLRRGFAPFLLALSLSACPPAEVAQAVDIAQSIDQGAHLLCTIAGMTDLQCVQRVLAERRMASLRISRDASAETDAP